MNRWITKAAIVLAVCLSFSGCSMLEDGASSSAESSQVSSVSSQPEKQEGVIKQSVLKISYDSGDSLNPYTAQNRLNLDLSTLLYSSLVRLDASLNPSYDLASDIQLDGTQCIVTLREALFSDGSAVTAEDVVASMQLAMESTTYSGRFQNVDSVQAQDGNVVIHLKSADPYFVSTLDFPIIKQGTEESPVGSGRYVYEKDSASAKLTANPSYYGGEMSLSTIELVHMADQESIQHALEINMLSFYVTDLSDGSTPGRFAAATQQIQLPNLVYAAISPKLDSTETFAIKRAISLAVDREQMALQAYSSYAAAATTPFMPGWTGIQEVEGWSSTADTKTAQELLNAEGYQREEATSPLTKDGKTLTVEILVNEENTARVQIAQLMAQSLNDLGMSASVNSLPFDQYQTAIERGKYDLYIGEMKLSPNMDLSALVEGDAQAKEQFDTLRSGGITMQQYVDGFEENPPFLPLCYRKGMMAYSRNIGGVENSSYADPFRGIESWTLGGN
ncbi:ABC transporter substrate-binding protein [Solibaculum mannosilyticum]|uniref:ABC transporter substrate-binding protein n=1 Tax=Solibaculum mannosilyticum TaxID=2780922 RepID=UPI0034C2EF2F